MNGRLKREFEGEEVLTTLLQDSQCDFTFDEVVEEFECGIEEGSQAGEIVAYCGTRAQIQRSDFRSTNLWEPFT